MEYFFFIASFNALFFLVLILQKKRKALHDRVLIYWLLYLGIATAIYAITMGSFPSAPFLSSGIIALFLLHGPFLHLYVSALTSSQKRFKAHKLWHFTPFVAFILFLFIASRFPSYSEGIRVDHVTHGAAEPPILFLIFLALTAVSGPVYFFMAHKRFRQLDRESLHTFSSKDINLEWLSKLITIFGIIWTILIVVTVIHHVFHLFSMIFCTNGLFLSLSVFIILIGFFGLRQKEVFISYADNGVGNLNTNNKAKYASSTLKDTELQKYFQEVESYMEVEKPYLDPELTLPKLAKDLNVPIHHLSQVINEVHGRNFFNFINQFRVEEVKQRIQDPKYHNYSMFGIAQDSGFNSKSAFNRVFKEFTGTTPSKFRDALTSS